MINIVWEKCKALIISAGLFIATVATLIFLSRKKPETISEREHKLDRLHQKEIKEIHASFEGEAKKKEQIEETLIAEKIKLKEATENANIALDAKMEEFKEEKIEEIKTDPEAAAENFAKEFGLKVEK